MVEKDHGSELVDNLQSVLDKTSLGVLKLDAKGNIVHCNDSICRSLGYSRDELLELGVQDIDASLRAFEFNESGTGLQRSHPCTVETTLRRKDGSSYPAEVTTGVFEIDGELYAHSISRDITKQRQSDEQQAQLEAHLRQQQKIEAISTLASGVAHEINNPINIVMNYAELIIARSAPEANVLPFAQEIINESQRIATIVRNLLAFAREEKENVQPATIEVIVERTLSLLREVLSKNNIELEVSIDENVPPITCQIQQIQQALMNLITNALDALNEGAPQDTQRKRIFIRATELAEQEQVRITVEDNGPGIDHDIAERVFDPFFTTKPVDKGTGLGLSVSHGIVKKHGGALSFESTPGQGTSFHMDFPIGVEIETILGTVSS